jgi:hypothetical protein
VDVLVVSLEGCDPTLMMIDEYTARSWQEGPGMSLHAPQSRDVKGNKGLYKRPPVPPIHLWTLLLLLNLFLLPSSCCWRHSEPGRREGGAAVQGGGRTCRCGCCSSREGSRGECCCGGKGCCRTGRR